MGLTWVEVVALGMPGGGNISKQGIPCAGQ